MPYDVMWHYECYNNGDGPYKDYIFLCKRYDVKFVPVSCMKEYRGKNSIALLILNRSFR